MNMSPQAASTDEVSWDPRRWVALTTLLIAAFMNLVDITIVNVALPVLQTSFGASTSQIQWVVAGYILAFSMGLLPFGRWGDIVGRRRVFVIGVSFFTMMSALSGFAPNIETLVAARIFQGIAGAMMMPQVLAIMQNIFPPEERGRAFAYFGLAASMAAVAGPVLGGYLISLDIFGLGWRPIFLINVPVGIAAVVASFRFIPNIKGNPELTNDRVGILIATASVLLLIYPLIEGRANGWPLWSFVMLGAAIPGFISLLIWQRFRERANKSQLLPLALLRNRNYAVGIFATMTFFSSLPGFFMIIALFLQNGFGLTPLQSGLATSPFPVGIFLASLLAGRLGSRALKQRLIIGTLLLIVGLAWTRQVILGVDGAIDSSIFLGPLFLAGIGLGTAVSVLFQTILMGVPMRDAGAGSGGLQAMQQLGAAIGVALIGQIFFTILTANGQPGMANYIEAAGSAMIFNLCAFALVIILALFLEIPDQPMPNRKNAAPASGKA